MEKLKYFLTYHAIERFQERFHENAQESNDVKFWERGQKLNLVKKFFDKLIIDSTENKSYLNNTNYMVECYEKYGYDSEYKFLEHTELGILFILTKDRSEDTFKLVTLMPTKYRKKYSLSNVKYNKKEKKENKRNHNFLKIYDEIKKIVYSFDNDDINIFERMRDLEKEPDYEIFHKDSLLKILKIFDDKKMTKNLESGQKLLKSEKFCYYFSYIDSQLIISKKEYIHKNEKLELKNYFNTMIELDNKVFESTIIKNISQDIIQRQIVINEIHYMFLYNQQTKNIDSYEYKYPEQNPNLPSNLNSQDEEQNILREQLICKNNKKGKEIPVVEITPEMLEEQNRQQKLTKSLTREEELFLRQRFSKENEIEKITPRISKYMLNYEGYEYKFTINKTKSEGYLLTVLEKNILQNQTKLKM